ncbi:MAG: hypothetical protein ACRDTU_01510 [Micromonosporaceae bacterium]
MADPQGAREWDLVVPEDDERLLAELRGHGARTGQRVHLSVVPAFDSQGSEELPEFFGSFDSGRPDRAERSSEILRTEFPNL